MHFTVDARDHVDGLQRERLAELQVRQRIRDDVQSGADQQQREYFLRKQLESIRRELGEDEADVIEEYRAKLANHPQLRGGILQLAETVRDKPRQALQPDVLIKLAVALDQLDTQMNLRQGYGELLRRPEDVIFAVTLTKAAADMASVCATPSGRVYRRQHLERLKVADLATALRVTIEKPIKTS